MSQVYGGSSASSCESVTSCAATLYIVNYVFRTTVMRFVFQNLHAVLVREEYRESKNCGAASVDSTSDVRVNFKEDERA